VVNTSRLTVKTIGFDAPQKEMIESLTQDFLSVFDMGKEVREVMVAPMRTTVDEDIMVYGTAGIQLNPLRWTVNLDVDMTQRQFKDTVIHELSHALMMTLQKWETLGRKKKKRMLIEEKLVRLLTKSIIYDSVKFRKLKDIPIEEW
jgi:hypothetical protein